MLKQDTSFLLDLLANVTQSTKFSFYMWWFPNDIQRVLEHLFNNKPPEQDVAGLLSLIAFAGIEEHEKAYFKDEIIKKHYRTKELTKNLFFEAQQNLSDLLFGTTLDDVSIFC